MSSIDEIILKSFNPFDRYKANNFWRENQENALVVDSIHAETISTASEMLDRVIADCRTRSLLIKGDSGSGKTYLLGRLKNALNIKAFFVYVSSCPQNDHIWRHVLRETVDSLVQVPQGQKESQLLLWLRNLSVFQKASLKEKLLTIPIWDLWQSDRYKGRQEFIKKLGELCKQSKIFNAEEFFGVLYDLTDPELYPLACNWLKGDSLSDDSLKALKVKKSIEDEETARKILANFGEISSETLPIVLCFDELENYEALPDELPNLLPLWTVISVIHNDFKNFFVMISVITDIWMRSQGSHKSSIIARLNQQLELKPINIDQAEALCIAHLHGLYSQAKPRPESPIYPLKREYLEEDFPGGRLRACLRIEEVKLNV